MAYRAMADCFGHPPTPIVNDTHTPIHTHHPPIHTHHNITTLPRPLPACAEAGQAVAYRGMVDCFVRTVREEGMQALFKGLAPNYVKVVPSIAIAFVTYEQVGAFPTYCFVVVRVWVWGSCVEVVIGELCQGGSLQHSPYTAQIWPA